MPPTPPSARVGRPGLLVALACLGQLLVVLDISIVNVALPSISESLDLSGSQLSWVVNAYTITFAGCVLLGGRIADLIGNRNAFVAGAALFSAASLVGGLASTAVMLGGARAFQGLGAALLAPATLTLITSGLSHGAERSRALGLWGAMGAAGGAVGSVLGGVVVDLSSWHWVFLINVPFGVLAAVAALRVIPDGERRRTRRPDVLGAVTVTGGLAVLVYGIVQGSESGWLSSGVLVPSAIGLLLLGAFVLVEGRVAAEPLVPLALLRVRTLVTANAVGFTAGAAGVAMWYFITLYEQEVLGMGPTIAGLGFVPHTLSLVFAARLSGRLLATVEPRRIMAIGMLTATVGFLLQSRASVDGTYVLDVMIPGVIICLGSGFAFPAITQVATSGLPVSDAGLASGVLNTARWFGGALGLAALTAIAATRTGAVEGVAVSDAALVDGFDLAFLASAGITLTGAALVALVPRTGPSGAAPREVDEAVVVSGEAMEPVLPAPDVFPEPA
jgi:EmrB/QacA subfamily drug resistance transporter